MQRTGHNDLYQLLTEQKIIKSYLEFKPNKMQRHQSVSLQNKERKLLMCSMIKNMFDKVHSTLRSVTFRDECHIYLQGRPNQPSN